MLSQVEWRTTEANGAGSAADVRRVAVAGEIFSSNLGDGVIHACVRDLFARHGVSVVPLDFAGKLNWSEAPAGVATSHRVSWVRSAARIPVRRSRTLRRIIGAWRWYGQRRRSLSETWAKEISSSDAVVIGGGQLLTDGFVFAPRIVEIARLARLLGKPIAFFGCGAGSGWGMVAKTMYGNAFSRAAYISVRDQVSARLVESALPPGRPVAVHPDPGFVVDRVFNGTRPQSEVRKLGLGPQPLQHIWNFVPHLRSVTEETYYSFWAKIAEQAERSGFAVEFFSNGDPDDQAQVERICDFMSVRGLPFSVANRPQHPAELATILRGYTDVICTRMHAGIVAFSFGATVYPISWDRKVNNVWDVLGRSQAVISPEILLQPERWLDVAGLRREAAAADSEERTAIAARIDEAAFDCLSALGILTE